MRTPSHHGYTSEPESKRTRPSSPHHKIKEKVTFLNLGVLIEMMYKEAHLPIHRAFPSKDFQKWKADGFLRPNRYHLMSFSPNLYYSPVVPIYAPPALSLNPSWTCSTERRLEVIYEIVFSLFLLSLRRNQAVASDKKRKKTAVCDSVLFFNIESDNEDKFLTSTEILASSRMMREMSLVIAISYIYFLFASFSLSLAVLSVLVTCTSEADDSCSRISVVLTSSARIKKKYQLKFSDIDIEDRAAEDIFVVILFGLVDNSFSRHNDGMDAW